MIVHIDGDVIVYRAGFACEKWLYHASVNGVVTTFTSKREMEAWAFEKGLGPGDFTYEVEHVVEPLPNALYNVRSIVGAIASDLGVEREDVRLYLSGPHNFRVKRATIKPYKGNRDPSHKPVHAAEIKAMMRREFNCIVSDGVEADDDIGTEHYEAWMRDPYSTVIATIDKDLDMIPGLHYNFVTKEQKYIEPDEGLWYFYRQLLMGDTVDNIPGIPGLGPVKATKLLPPIGSPEVDLFDCVVAAYKKHYGDDKWCEALREVGDLLWIRRQRGIGWQPVLLNSVKETTDASVSDAEAGPEPDLRSEAGAVVGGEGG